ncbi:PREDICTED: RWD domain-containing protein 1 isoform X1 [Galeopterus variegatus]|uniref:RWD domain-containing protein 1 isoform X1 n=2 Tax=Galeopterus variegatus TaxID=482537 RepID=A0ABM0QC71_GALVR|nr:PREDICTED: RWD domain-containing protein 1 isoform X1 [Galeopterus variegatus]
MPDRTPSPSQQILSRRGAGGNQCPSGQAERVERRIREQAEAGAGLLLSRPGLALGPGPTTRELCACARPAAARSPGLGCSAPPGCLGDPWAAARATMTDYGEEQRNELEALESIYPDSFTVLSENPPSFTITVTSEAGENDETVQTTLKFTYSENYPDEAPLYEIFSQENLEDNDVSDILKLLALQAEENLGMVMIFTLVTAVQEKLNEIVDQIKTRREEEKKQKEKEAEEAEKQLFHGTPVTIENFLSWKAKFDAELLEIKKKRMKEEEQAGKNKLSGKQLFETDHNLDTSDIQFLEDAGNNVEVDESLFQEMDDLELEDDEDDPDYNPADPESDSTD